MVEKSVSTTPSPLPPLAASNALTEEQWNVFAAIVEAIVPSITRVGAASAPATGALNSAVYDKAVQDIRQHGGPEDANLISEYLAESPTANAEFRDSINRLLTEYMDDDQRKGLIFILNALNASVTSYLLTGYSTPIVKCSIPIREQIIQKWATARLPLFRSLHASLTAVARVYWIRTSPTLGNVLSYPKNPINHNFGPGFPFAFIQFPPLSTESTTLKPDVATLETDVLILGSGCTGAVAASVLAKSGLAVTVAERNYYWPPNHLPMSESAAATHLFRNGGITTADSGNMSILSGSCWGGGGTVNWSASLQLQNFVREKWATDGGLPYFTSAAFQADLDAVCDRMGVGTASVKHNFTNQRLLDGARKLGMSGKTVPQNTGGEAHECGYCTLGCGSCGKKGPTESWLPDAARAGAKFVEGFECSRVIFSDKPAKNGEKIAIGAEGIWTSRDENGGVSGKLHSRPVKILARRVVVAGGALGTPHLLKRSGLRNPHIGSHLKLHPVSVLGAIFDTDVRPWDGGILTSVVTDFENINSSSYGAKLEALTMLPGLYLPLFQWKSGLDWKVFAAKMRRMTGYISLARDEGEGSVYVDPTDNNRLRVKYDVGKKDQKRIAIGLIALAKCMFVEGAREIFVNVAGIPTWVRQDAADAASTATLNGEDDVTGVNDPSFREWLAHLERLVENGMPGDAQYASAHQMGTARMGSSAKKSAVDPHGRVWGTQGLYVADTSVFPAASGVNPMITGMATARGIARGLVKDLAGHATPVPTTTDTRARL